jgi:recombination protein RecT
MAQRVSSELMDREKDIRSILPEYLSYERFKHMALMAVAKTPALQQCKLSSVYLSLMECARLGLYPDGRQAAIVPFKDSAVLIPMVQGVIELMLRSPKVAKVEARAV